MFRLLAACLAFIPAMLFGVVAVNKYYGYYQTWRAALADLTGNGGSTGNTALPPALAVGSQLSTLTRSDTYLRLAQAAALEAAAQSPHPRPSGSAAPRHHRQARHPALAAQRASAQHSS